jgi:hypothetical protein
MVKIEDVIFQFFELLLKIEVKQRANIDDNTKNEEDFNKRYKRSH